MIFDVRSNKDDNDYQGAADIANLVVPSGTTVFTIKEAGGNTHICSTRESTQTFLGPVIVLTNRQTTGAGEALADYLRQYRGAIVLGQTTRGQTAVLSWTPLSSGQVLWFPTARVSLPNGIDLWNQPVVPDIALTVDDRAEKGALVLIKDNHILDVIEESAERHRMSEASLVRGQDPEWDEYVASLERKPVLLSLPIIHDVVLIRALDSLKAIRLSQSPLPAQARADASPPASASLQ
jgi:C-terminal processing protease CtpA/Prc